jgi:hypothetical protein
MFEKCKLEFKELKIEYGFIVGRIYVEKAFVQVLLNVSDFEGKRWKL